MKLTETKVAHTPGPWRIVLDFNSDQHDGAYASISSVVADHDYYIAQVWEDFEAEGDEQPVDGIQPKGTAQVNAHLIAAAPELLDALKACESKLYLMGREFASPRFTDRYEDGPTMLRLAEMARAAIMKAEGR